MPFSDPHGCMLVVPVVEFNLYLMSVASVIQGHRPPDIFSTFLRVMPQDCIYTLPSVDLQPRPDVTGPRLSTVKITASRKSI
jgi:hypothetical protein